MCRGVAVEQLQLSWHFSPRQLLFADPLIGSLVNIAQQYNHQPSHQHKYYHNYWSPHQSPATGRMKVGGGYIDVLVLYLPKINV